MTEELTKKVVDLYKRKSDLSDSISRLTAAYRICGTAIQSSDRSWIYNCSYIDLEFCKDELKEFTLIKLKNELLKIELELQKISC